LAVESPEPSARAPALKLEGLTKRYPRAEGDAVRDLDLELGSREVLAVVGRSGCGKTTLLRLVAGLEVPDRGRISIAGRVMVDERAWVQPEDRGVGMVFQEFALFPHLTVEDNIAYGMRGLPRAERRARTAELLRLVDLPALGRRYPHQLSGGQQQRVALARALAPGPRLLLLDEPFSNLDAPLKGSLREALIRVLRERGVPTMLVVHDIEDVVVLADRVAVMRAGCIVRIGQPVQLCREPGDGYVAQFFEQLRTPGANRFERPGASAASMEEPEEGGRETPSVGEGHPGT